MDPFILKIKKSLLDHKMVEPGDCVLVGVSGGPDSVALLQALIELKQEFNIELAVAHLNHGARGEESDHDARFVKDLGASFNLRTLIKKINVPELQPASKSSFQETARDIRLEFFQETMKQLGANKIALGHTSDDQVETVLMNLLRGSGLKGVGGMSPVRLPYIRPLFYCTRAEVMGFLNDRNTPFCKDSSNNKKDYLRNRIRLELIPFLQEKYNPKITENLFETSGIFRADNDCLKVLEDHEFEQAISNFEDGEMLSMDMKYLNKLPLALQRRLVRKGILSIKGDLRKISSFHIQEILHLFETSRKGKRIDLPDNLEVVCKGNCVEFKRIPQTDTSILTDEENKGAPRIRPLIIPGETEIEETGLTLKSEIINPVTTEFPGGKANQAFLDFDKTGSEVMIRFFQAGDRLKPLGMKGTKKLKSLFIDEKVPQEIRSTVPILTTGDNDIIWVYGTRIAEDYRVTSETSKILFIKGLA
jgi:tRNA(Ile)-lysidine synthase